MNTVEKGDRLEDQVYAYFKAQIESNQFIAKPELCEIFQKKGYYSHKRKKEIIFDVTIEISLPNQESYSILWVIECKNYGDNVPVGDVEEFCYKLHSVSGLNVKGVVITNNSFQEGSFNTAETEGVGLARLNTNNELKWILNRSPSSLKAIENRTGETEARLALTSEISSSSYFDFSFFSNGRFTSFFSQFLETFSKDIIEDEGLQPLLNTTRNVDTNAVPYLSKKQIAGVAQELVDDLDCVNPSEILDKLCEKTVEQCDLKVLRNQALSTGVLGSITFEPLEIRIDDKQCGGVERARFTVAHELGHLYLKHGSLLSKENCFSTNLNFDDNEISLIEDITRIEIQANTFASYLLIPDSFLELELKKVIQAFNLIDRGYGFLYVDNQDCNKANYYKVTDYLKRKFHVSRQVVHIRLKNIGFLTGPNNTINSNESSFHIFGARS